MAGEGIATALVAVAGEAHLDAPRPAPAFRDQVLRKVGDEQRVVVVHQRELAGGLLLTW